MLMHKSSAAAACPRTDSRSAAHRIWATVPPEFAERLRPLAGQITADAITEIQRAVAAYQRPLTGKFRELLVGSVDVAVRQAYDYLGNPDARQDEWAAAFRRAGRVEFLEGRTTDALQTAVRVGARVAWRHLSAEGQAAGVSAEVLFAIADAIFVYVDEMCAVAVEGYTEAQAQASGARERRRRELLRLLVAETATPATTLAALAASADWVMPERLAVIALEYLESKVPTPRAMFPDSVLVDLESYEPCLVLPDPDEATLVAVTARLGVRRGAVGPTVDAADAPRSLALARRAVELANRGVLSGRQLIRCDDHLTTLALLSDEFLVDRIAENVLAPLADLTDKQRERLESTLLAWLATRGGVAEVATRLSVHPQTVRYRLHQLEDLFGDSLTDHEKRFAIEIALRARALRSPKRTQGQGSPHPASRAAR
ncbi:helix-turn-helix domain-containing protein [Actinokineospora iranica]|uniref:PucR C-terminal helix-turn-helix domain-containing protein n=1 Tax=Actinokineospora iranica TaxID=1271860 RepID=A0A1G6RXE9_9PSEU|nr:PucR family transcriptional regulator [Actinokineospora iranica]SDD09248.1 PucR C-terminal helix-turn-helix domain-containing protein [Actinokineospora iranica]